MTDPRTTPFRLASHSGGRGGAARRVIAAGRVLALVVDVVIVVIGGALIVLGVATAASALGDWFQLYHGGR